MNPILRWVATGAALVIEALVMFWLGGLIYYGMGIFLSGLAAFWFFGPFLRRRKK